LWGESVLEEYSLLEKFRDIVYYCFKCGMCRFESYEGIDNGESLSSLFMDVCPMWDLWKLEAYTALGKNEICRGLLEKKIPFNEKTVKIIYACTLCGACEKQCSVSRKTKHIERFGGSLLPYNPLEIALALRLQAVKTGVGPLPQHKKFSESIRVNKNPYWEPHQDRFKWFKGSLPKEAETAYFVGCTASYRQQMIAENAVKIFNKLGVEFTLVDEWCCGSPLFTTGQEEFIKELAIHNISVLEDAGVRRLIVSCAGCYRTFKKVYPEILGENLPFQVLHMAEFLSEKIEKGRLNFTSTINEKITYHDPCHLGRHCGVYEAPRRVLAKIPGLRFTEMRRKIDHSYCCGAGAGFRAAFPEASVKVAGLRVKEAEELGVDSLVTACSFCRRNLDDGVKAVDGKIKVYNIEELVAKAMGC